MTAHNLTMRFESEIGNEYEITYDSDYFVDRHYGADADGNRGIKMVEHDVGINGMINLRTGRSLKLSRIPDTVMEKLVEYVIENHDEDELIADAKELQAEREFDRMRGN